MHTNDNVKTIKGATTEVTTIMDFFFEHGIKLVPVNNQWQFQFERGVDGLDGSVLYPDKTVARDAIVNLLRTRGVLARAA